MTGTDRDGNGTDTVSYVLHVTGTGKGTDAVSKCPSATQSRYHSVTVSQCHSSILRRLTRASNLFSAVTKGSPVSSATAAATFTSNLHGTPQARGPELANYQMRLG